MDSYEIGCQLPNMVVLLMCRLLCNQM